MSETVMDAEERAGAEVIAPPSKETTMKIEIKQRFTGAVLFSAEADEGDRYPMRSALTKALAAGANLAGADLYRADLYRANLAGADLDGANLAGADLYRANLDGADLDGANLAGANLDGANLYRANLAGANLAGANLAGANLAGANLDGANLDGANLAGANLAGANLAGANLAGANLAGANLAGIRDDIYEVLSHAPTEAPGLLAAIREGRVDGSAYQGECACLVGTIANVRGADYRNLDGIKPASSRPAERWFLGINRGDTPESSQISKITAEWIDAWIAQRQQDAIAKEVAQ